jgi:hypothetical protein
MFAVRMSLHGVDTLPESNILGPLGSIGPHRKLLLPTVTVSVVPPRLMKLVQDGRPGRSNHIAVDPGALSAT